MPRKPDPLSALRAHEKNLAAQAAKGRKLKDAACTYLGRLVMDAGLDKWDTPQLVSALTDLAKNGAGNSPTGDEQDLSIASVAAE